MSDNAFINKRGCSNYSVQGAKQFSFNPYGNVICGDQDIFKSFFGDWLNRTKKI